MAVFKIHKSHELFHLELKFFHKSIIISLFRRYIGGVVKLLSNAHHLMTRTIRHKVCSHWRINYWFFHNVYFFLSMIIFLWPPGFLPSSAFEHKLIYFLSTFSSVLYPLWVKKSYYQCRKMLWWCPKVYLRWERNGLFSIVCTYYFTYAPHLTSA